MFIELHLIQNFAPSNLNRDDTGAPKDCEFGGHRRARISSQCLKRAVRTAFRDDDLLPRDGLATRTKRLGAELTRRFTNAGRPEGEAEAVAGTLIRGLGLKQEEDGKTQYLLFLGEAEIATLVQVANTHWDILSSIAAPAAEENAPAGGRRSGRGAKKQAQAAVPAEVQAALRTVLDGGKAADLALFGRMLADLPQHNVHAACQVAHALSTNSVEMEFDFYTAVDDLLPSDTTGSDMMGTIEFNSACFYRYAAVDLGQLTKNLGGDEELARRTLEAFIRASISAIPTGKQNSMAAQNRPSLVLAVARDRGLCSLANAFVKPVFPNRDGDLIQNSIRALDRFWGQMAAMYGQDGVAGAWVATPEREALDGLAEAHVAGVDALVTQVLSAAQFGANGRQAGAS